MVKRSADLDAIFQSLAHPVRRDILQRGSRREMTVGDLAKPYGLSLPAISKHLRVLEQAKFITKRRVGKQFFVSISPFAFEEAAAYLKEYERLWNNRLDRLERYLSSILPKK